MTCALKGRERSCSPDCHGWEWFNGMEIEACDACDVLDDDAAKAHIAVCRDCQQKLGKHVIDMLTEYRCFGVWPVFGDVHELPEIPHNPDNPGEYPEWWKKQNP